MLIGASGDCFGFGKGVDADDGLRAAFDVAQAGGVGFNKAAFHVVDRCDGAAHLVDGGQFGASLLLELGDFGFDFLGAIEDVAVAKQVGFEGEDLLHAQGPLLVPGTRQAKSFIPGGQLHGTGAGALSTA